MKYRLPGSPPYLPTVDSLADELLSALRDHPGVAEHRLMDPASGEPSRLLCEAYNRLYCELHDKVIGVSPLKTIRAQLPPEPPA